MRFVLLLSILATFLGINVFVIYKVCNLLPYGTWTRYPFVAVFVFGLAAFIAGILLRSNGVVPTNVTTFLYNIGTNWFFVNIYLLLILLIFSLLQAIHLLPPSAVLRMHFTAIGCIAALTAAILCTGYYIYTQKARVPLTINIHKKKIAESPLKIVMISDLHLGYNIHRNEFEKWVKLINDEHPDLLLIPGDIIDSDTRPLYSDNITAAFKEIKTKYGIFAVPGNHEYFANIDRSVAFLKQTGITLLRDSTALVNNSFYIIGRDDRTNTKRKSLAMLMQGIDTSKPLILLDHQPYDLEEAQKNGIDLQLSGHTHYGQIWPFSWVTDLLFEKAHGYLQKGNYHVFVSSGIGIWGGKFRIGTRSEYVVINCIVN